MTETSDNRLIEMVRAAGFSFGPVIMAEARREGVELATALALVQQESGFRNIFGCDLGHRKTVPWCHQHVTRDRVKALIAHVKAGGISNGVGLSQLTDIGGYNGGPGNPDLDYADDVLALRGAWRARISRALRGDAPPGDRAVHRDLMLTTPNTEGPDVRALQRAI